MTLKEFKIYFSEELSSMYPNTEKDSFFSIIIEEKLSLQRIDTVLKPDFKIDDTIFAEIKTIIERLKNEEPIQYIFGKTEFYGLPFYVDGNTLIPRPETEELVEWILLCVQDLKLKIQSCTSTKNENNTLSILDIGTGTGCIPISLAKNLQNVAISAIDISSEALKIAKQNAILNKVEVDFFELDILQAVKLPQQYDIIVSNPPYVRELEKAEINNNVLENEPHLALFVDDENPLIFYKKIADLAKQHLSKNGLLFFEINQYLGKETVKMLKDKGFIDIELKKDLFGNNRMIKSSLN
ncbi:peptide chain release factor N(5)-glutamine methyltransferase [Polaribacter haliotis]|uniref:Release factor glutamine methyltransferase n=1 Tax=Polaribacter haliotis TaxID=1888915 RepID=A0A7L8AFM7_9FLAO|nr:peptide chain release factor N(5)-glutamine methyltransferase [Polaribacter haliotis]QOD60815.1 peptide chain release factor N(5)-glutamine methyltransferase [Polaribacter haliotis]